MNRPPSSPIGDKTVGAASKTSVNQMQAPLQHQPACRHTRPEVQWVQTYRWFCIFQHLDYKLHTHIVILSPQRTVLNISCFPGCHLFPVISLCNKSQRPERKPFLERDILYHHWKHLGAFIYLLLFLNGGLKVPQISQSAFFSFDKHFPQLQIFSKLAET